MRLHLKTKITLTIALLVLAVVGASSWLYLAALTRQVIRQADERDIAKRAALLDQIQQLTIDRVMFAPIMDLRALNGIGPRVTKDTITDVWMSPFPSYEDMEIKE